MLLIAPEFFGCDEAIELEMLSRGAVVKRIFDRPFNSSILKVVALLAGAIVSKLLESYYKSKLNAVVGKVDLILVINGQTLSFNTLKHISFRWPVSKKILYMWDSLNNRPVEEKKLGWYDKKLTFERGYDDLDFKFRPLFYSGDVLDVKESNCFSKYKVSFIGTCHSDRYEVVNKILTVFKGHEIFLYFYIQAKWVYIFKRFLLSSFGGSKMSDFNFVGLDSTLSKKVFNQTEILLDVEHPKQNGLTIRTFDSIRAGKKIITTNESIKQYDFYKCGNILVVDRKEPVVPEEFINRDANRYDNNILYKYSVAGWLNDVLD